RLDERHGVVGDHGLLVREVHGGIAVLDGDSRFGELLPSRLVVLLAAAALGVEHDLRPDAALVRVDDRFDQGGIGENEHLDAERLPGAPDRFENRRGGVVGKHDEGARRHWWNPPVSPNYSWSPAEARAVRRAKPASGRVSQAERGHRMPATEIF